LCISLVLTLSPHNRNDSSLHPPNVVVPNDNNNNNDDDDNGD